MLIDFEYKNKKLIVSYIDNNGNIKIKYYDWNSPTKYTICHEDDPDRDGKYVTWDGKTLKNMYTSRPDKYAIYNFIDSLDKEEQDLLFEYNEPNIFFIDIENEITDKKASPETAETAIQTISIVFKDKAMVMGTRDLSDDEVQSINKEVNEYTSSTYKFSYVKYKNEFDMLYNFFNKYIPKMAVLTGWNFKEYDWVFLVNRARRIGINPEAVSFTKRLYQPNKNEKDKFGKPSNFERPAHRLIIDYMDLFLKWDTSVKVKEADSLDFASEALTGLKKVNYEGNLKILYETDYRKFVYYNVMDSILVQKIHEKMRYVDILYGIATLSRIRTFDGFKTIPITEGIFRDKLKDNRNIILCKDENKEEGEKVIGGWVKKPVPGMSPWTCCYDYASLYPKSMIEFNISPDTYKGVLSKDGTYSVFNNHRIELEKDDIITVNNTVYRKEEGIVTKTLKDIYKDRKKYKNMMLAKDVEIEELKKELANLETELLNEDLEFA